MSSLTMLDPRRARAYPFGIRVKAGALRPRRQALSLPQIRKILTAYALGLVPLGAFNNRSRASDPWFKSRFKPPCPDQFKHILHFRQTAPISTSFEREYPYCMEPSALQLWL